MCYTGFDITDNECVLQGELSYVFEFVYPLPQDSDGVIADYCNPPIVIDERGGYFDGLGNSVEVTNF